MDGVDNATWRKSTQSGNNGGACVEVGNSAREVLVRDTTNRGGGILGFTVEVWQEFIGSLR